MRENPGKQQPILVDGHVDLPYYLMKKAPDSDFAHLDKGPFTLEKARKSGLRLFCCALYCEDLYNGDQSFSRLKSLLTFTQDRVNQVTVIRDGRELRQVQSDPDAVGTFRLLENADALAGNESFIDTLTEMGVRIIGLTHMGRNRLGDGNGISYPGGMSVQGKQILRTIQHKELAVDCAHLHPKCFWQVLDLFQGLILTSHTGVRERCGLQRNIALQQAAEIVGREGIIGITFNPEMLSTSGMASPEDIFAHLDTVVQRFGPQWVGIGSDFCGFEGVTEGMEDITGIALLTERMNAHGYDETAINGILGLNWIRVLKTIFP